MEKNRTSDSNSKDTCLKILQIAEEEFLEKGFNSSSLRTIVKAEQDKNKAPVLFLAEGVFMYLTLQEIRKFLTVLKNNFSCGTLIAEQNNPMMVEKQNLHDTLKNTNAVFKSGTWSGKEIADLLEGIRFIEEHSFNEEMRKYSFGGWLFATLLPKMNDCWAKFEW